MATESADFEMVSAKRALMLAYYFPPISSAGTYRTARFVRYLPEFGWKPLVVSVQPKPAGELQDDSLLQMIPESTIVNRTSVCHPDAAISSLVRLLSGLFTRNHEPASNGHVKMTPLPTDSPATSSPGRLGQRLRDVRDAVFNTPDKYVWWVSPAVRMALQLVARWRPQVIYTSGPPHSTHLAGLLLKWTTRLPWVADFRDPWSRKPWGRKVTNPWGQRLHGIFERICVRAADRVILNTEPMAREFRAAYPALAPSRFMAIPNGLDPAVQDAIVQPSRNGSSNGRVRLCHPGSLYRKRDPRPLLAAMKQLADSGLVVEFEQIGHCDTRFDLGSCVRDLKLQGQVDLRGTALHSEVLDRMRHSDILVVIQPENQLQIPGKLFEMLMFRKPILALADDGATTEVIREFQIGLTAPSNSPDAIASAIRQIADDRQRFARDEIWDRASQAFDGQNLTRLLADQFDTVSQHRWRQE